jgi:hypothetical protein
VKIYYFLKPISYTEKKGIMFCNKDIKTHNPEEQNYSINTKDNNYE